MADYSSYDPSPKEIKKWLKEEKAENAKTERKKELQQEFLDRFSVYSGIVSVEDKRTQCYHKFDEYQQLQLYFDGKPVFGDWPRDTVDKLHSSFYPFLNPKRNQSPKLVLDKTASVDKVTKWLAYAVMPVLLEEYTKRTLSRDLLSELSFLKWSLADCDGHWGDRPACLYVEISETYDLKAEVPAHAWRFKDRTCIYFWELDKTHPPIEYRRDINDSREQKDVAEALVQLGKKIASHLAIRLMASGALKTS
jgi:hypothetical protein